MSWLTEYVRPKIRTLFTRREVPDNLWHQCPACQQMIFAADLVHRSHPRRLPPETSRLSCVTHYCPATTAPFWFRFHPEHRRLQPHGIGAFASAYYRLPIEGGMAAPVRGTGRTS